MPERYLAELTQGLSPLEALARQPETALAGQFPPVGDRVLRLFSGISVRLNGGLLRWFVQVSSSSRRPRPPKREQHGSLTGYLPSWMR